MKKQIMVGAFVLVLGLTGTVFATNDKPKVDNNKKYFVCKYVGKPGTDERLQTGNNPISVSENALTNPVVGGYFNDAQGRSLVVAEDTGQDEPTCPAGDTPPVVDVCDNIDGVQATVPANHTLNGKVCTENDAGDYTDGKQDTPSTPVEDTVYPAFQGK